MEVIFLIFFALTCSVESEDKCLQPGYVSCDIQKKDQCIPLEWWCDGHIDCDNGGDEIECKSNACLETEIECKTGTQCIPKFLRCDGKAQCLDQSDETDCLSQHSKSCDYRTQFDCNNDGLNCISLKNVCDGRNDCGRNQDENPKGLIENCQRNDCRVTYNGGCSHFCTNLYTEIVCHCRGGYRLMEDKKTCVDINECSLLPEKCSQICNNTDGSYQCLCHEGYILNPKIPGHCIARDGDRLMLVTLGDGEIITLGLENNNNVVNNISITSIDWTNIDVHVIGRSNIEIFWSNFNNKKVGKTIIKRKESSSSSFEIILESEIFHLKNGSFCSGLSYDWLRSLLFWTSTEDPKIYVTNTTSNKTTIFLKDGLNDPRSIAVNPFETRIYWIDWGNKLSSPSIETMLMNRGDRRVIVKEGLHQPQSLLLDFLDHRLYWSDINPGSIIFIDLNRPLMKKTVISNQLLHPFAMSIFEDKIFFTDWRHNQIISVGKTSGNDMKMIKKLSKPMSISVLNGLVKPLNDLSKSQIHTCINSESHPCSDLCLPSPPTINRFYASINCVCGIGSIMSSNKNSCITAGFSLTLPRNIHRFKIIVVVMISLLVTFVLFIVIILIYLCRERLCYKSYNNISQQEIKHHIVTGDLMFIFRCQSHSSQLSELLNNDFNSTTTA